MRALFNDFLQGATDLWLKCYQPERKSYWWAQKISAFFLLYSVHMHTAHFQCVFRLPYTLCRGQQTFIHAHFNVNLSSNTKKGITIKLHVAWMLKFFVKLQVIITLNLVFLGMGYRSKLGCNIEKRPHTHFLRKLTVLWKRMIEI